LQAHLPSERLERSRERFVKVIPRDFKRALTSAGKAEAVKA